MTSTTSSSGVYKDAELRQKNSKELKKLLLVHHPDKGGEKEVFEQVHTHYKRWEEREKIWEDVRDIGWRIRQTEDDIDKKRTWTDEVRE